MQRKLVVAYRQGDIVEVHRLQEKLVMSWKSRALAVRLATVSPGSKTPGVDKDT
jgi:hypothetical protein